MKKIFVIFLLLLAVASCVKTFAQPNGNFQSVRFKAGLDTASFSPQPNGTLLYANSGKLLFKTATYWKEIAQLQPGSYPYWKSSGATTITTPTLTGSFTLVGNETLTGNLTGTGDITRTGNIALTGNLTGTGDITRTGNIALTGNLTGTGTINRAGLFTIDTKNGASYFKSKTYGGLYNGLGTNFGGFDGTSIYAPSTKYVQLISGDSTLTSDNGRLVVLNNGVSALVKASGVSSSLDVSSTLVSVTGSTLQLSAGTATTITPLKFTSGTINTSPVSGAMEFDGTDYYITTGTTRYTINRVLKFTDSFSLGGITTGTCANRNVVATGAAVGDAVVIGLDVVTYYQTAGVSVYGYVSATNQVTITACNNSGSTFTPAATNAKVKVIK